MPLLPANGTCAYNGITFTSLFRSKLSGKPTYDESGRSVKYVDWLLEVAGYIQSPTGTDATMTAVRQALTQPGGQLDYINKGFGSLSVNNPVAVPHDVAWGPHPELLEFTPLGGSNAAFIMWRCSVRIPECSNAVYANSVMAVNFETDYSFDEAGLLDLEYRGYLEIPQTRRAGLRIVFDNADNYLSLVKPNIPLGFTLARHNHTVSKDKCRLDFTWVMRELWAPYPTHVVAADIEERLSSDLPRGFTQWAFDISGTITLAKGVPKSLAYEKFLMILRDRVARQRQKGYTCLLHRFEAGNELFGRSSSFSVGYVLIRKNPENPVIYSIVSDSGLWQPIAGTDFASWKASLLPYAFHERGYSRAVDRSDTIVDLCASLQIGRPAPPASNQPTKGIPTSPAESTGVTPKNSWLDYYNELKYEEDSSTVIHKPLAPEKQRGGGPSQNSAFYDPTDGSGGPSMLGQTGTPAAVGGGEGLKDIVQQPVAPTRYVRMKGYALRLHYRIPIPRLISVGGVKVTEIDRKVVEVPLTAILAMPLYMVTWDIRYLLPEKPKDFPHVSNPVLGVEGGTGSAGKKPPS